MEKWSSKRPRYCMANIGSFKAKGEKPKTGLFENNILIKEIKQYSYDDKKTEAFKLAIIPEIPKKKSFITRRYNSKNIASTNTNNTSSGWKSFRNWNYPFCIPSSVLTSLYLILKYIWTQNLYFELI